VGSDWTWELQVPVTAEQALREVYALAATRDLHPHRPDSLINLFALDHPGHRTVDDPRIAAAAMATGRESGQLWTPDGALWLDAAQRLHATTGRVLDEWSTEQIRHLALAGPWPAELSWLTYLSPGHPAPRLSELRALPLPHMPEIRPLPGGAVLITLLDDPAAVDPVRYQDIHARRLETLR
jgi:hypothetical protein